MLTAPSIDLADRSAARRARLRRRGDLKRLLLGVLLLGLMVATHARAEHHAGGGSVAGFGDALAGVVDDRGLVDYAALAADPRARAAVRAQSGALAGGVDALEPAARLAALMNTYNAAVLHLLLEAGAGGSGAIDGILDVDGGDVFDTPRVPLGGETVSLNQLEKEHIGPLAGDPRYHFAINCGALSCPPLRAEAYTADRLQEQLDDQRDRTLAGGDPRFVVWDGDGAVRVTKLMDWYGDEFGDPAAYLGEHAGLPGPVTEVGFLGYDWSLNAQPSAK